MNENSNLNVSDHMCILKELNVLENTRSRIVIGELKRQNEIINV